MIALIPQYTELVNICQIILTYQGETFTFEQGKLLMAQNTNYRALGLCMEDEKIALPLDAHPIQAEVKMDCKKQPQYIDSLRVYQNQGDILLFQYNTNTNN